MSDRQAPQPNMNTVIRRRILALVAVLILLGFGSVVYSLVDLQIIEYEDYKVKAANQQLKDTVIPANRGVIYDANMKVLAQSATVWTVAVAPSEIDEKDRAGHRRRPLRDPGRRRAVGARQAGKDQKLLPDHQAQGGKAGGGRGAPVRHRGQRRQGL